MKNASQILCGGLFAIALCNVVWDGFPTMLLLYGLMTGVSLLMGFVCLRCGRSPDQDAVRRRLSRLMGGLFLANAAVFPAGFLLGLVLEFDRDFILIIQIAGIPAIALPGLLAGGRRGRAQG